MASSDLDTFEEDLVKQYEESLASSNDAAPPPSSASSPPPRFLADPMVDRGERVALASYPRSGNSLLRKLLETLTDVVTGSDTLPNRAMSEQLRGYGLVGESCVNRTWVVKTHFPERYGWRRYKVQRGLLLVRNPFNAIDSYFNMQLTATHTQSLEDGEYERFGDVWDTFVREEADMWVKFHEYWLGTKIPLLVVRYEDLVNDKENEMARIARFLNAPSAAGAGGAAAGPALPVDFEAKRHHFASKEAGLVYKPRSGRVRPKLDHFSEAQQDAVLERAHKLLDAFGYLPFESAAPADGGAASAAADASAADDSARIRCVNKGKEASTVVNKGDPMDAGVSRLCIRPITEADPAGRGFPWKWELRKLVRLKGKSGSSEGAKADSARADAAICSGDATGAAGVLQDAAAAT